MNPSLYKDRLGFSIKELCKAIPCGRTKLYSEARAGKIKLSKIGDKTICTVPHAIEYMQSLPVVNLQNEPEAE